MNNRISVFVREAIASKDHIFYIQWLKEENEGRQVTFCTEAINQVWDLHTNADIQTVLNFDVKFSIAIKSTNRTQLEEIIRKHVGLDLVKFTWENHEGITEVLNVV